MLKKLLVVVAILVFSSTCWAKEPDLGPDIYVALALKQISVQLRGQDVYQIYDVKNNNLLYSSSKQENSFLNVRSNSLYLNNLKLPNKIRIRAAENSLLQINRRTYRGELLISVEAENRINVVNILPLEEYLYSVLPQEMPASWPEQALKAQAVTARSFAYSALGRRDNLGYDILADTSSQVYGGKEYENSTTTKVIKDTYGEVVVFNNKVVETFFHSSGGGQTESSLAVWGTSIPYLQSVVDFDQKSPHYKWRVSFSPEEFDQLFNVAGYQLGKIRALELSQLPKGTDKSSADRSISGRLSQVKILGEQGWEIVSGNKFREILKLKSTLFDIAIGIPMPDTIEAPLLDQFGNQVGQVDIDINLDNKNSIGLPQDGENIRRLSRSNNEKIIITGYGWGHGVGMSQWGAKGMAEAALAELENKETEQAKLEKSKVVKEKEPTVKEQAVDNKKAETADKGAKATDNAVKKVELAKDFYQKIIKYYFSGCSVKKIY